MYATLKILEDKMTGMMLLLYRKGQIFMNKRVRAWVSSKALEYKDEVDMPNFVMLTCAEVS